MMSIKILMPLVLTALSVMTFSSCKDEMAKIVTDESVKDISGSWKVVQLTRNGEDLGKRMDLENFKINFKSDGTYTLADQLPFIVDVPGKYVFNDPQYPFSLILTPEDDKKDIALKFQFPVIAGERQLSLTFSLGCSSNIYQFNFEREN
ncbi:DUF5004 domain-containing protein [Sphingobacterium faecium]|uniref:DUF5004 domain-containing protein n=1 Tax=Sphingobacterium faecium TaxID=34087 RepID=UPI00246924BA|nr:DUF5004 domain-containing protein [Sphingobacterium faecium]MDH5825945.1 DUF5004 domain-containing protein [Sphingobacterium faecium]